MEIQTKQSSNVLEGLHLFVKRDCPTCKLIESSIYQLVKESDQPLAIYIQDDPKFLMDLKEVKDDTELEQSYHFKVETVPTLIRVENGQEIARAVGWHKREWQTLTGLDSFGSELPEQRPGCGSRSVAPGIAEVLQVRYGQLPFSSRQVTVSEWDDPIEQAFDRGWSDGLPIVPPTAERILRMLQGTTRPGEEIIGKVPPNLIDCSIEKVAINAVMAGCKPEYMPVVLAALEAALDPLFTLHGLLCTTCFSSPIIVVNGPIARHIGMNWGINALGQGNRANATIGRALQLIVRNVGGGRPGEIDRATLGGPGKYTFCFAEDETDPSWEPLSVARGFEPGSNTVTLFQGDGIQGFSDQRSRTPDELTRSLALSLFTCMHPKLAEWGNAILVLSPEHYAIYREAGWDRRRITDALHQALVRPGRELIRGAQGVGEGILEHRVNEMVPKFFDDGLLIVRAGGPAGLFSAILSGWTGGRIREQSKPVTREIGK